MKDLFQFVLDNYIDNARKVNKDNDVYKTLVRDIPKIISNFLDHRNDLLVKGSMGQGTKTNYPWISILNKEITNSTQEGLYVVYLFRSDMKGFYLTLNQGITNFERKFGKDKYKYLEKVSKYFKDEFKNDLKFSIEPIDLVSKRNTRGYGYEKSTIISKYYDSKNFKNEDLFNDLTEMINAYDLVYKHMEDSSYNKLIESVIADDESYIPIDQAITKIEHVLQEEVSYPRYNKKELIEVKPQSEKSARFKKIVKGANSKIDYLKKAAQDAYTGLEGEKLVLSFEQQRLTSLGFSEYAQKVDWVSLQNDVAGYDIKSYDIDDNQKIHEIFIEVKTSVSKIDTDFFVSKNEVETSKKLQKNYRVFRIYNVLSLQPKYYIADGEIESNFTIEPVTFRASFKWQVL